MLCVLHQPLEVDPRQEVDRVGEDMQRGVQIVDSNYPRRTAALVQPGLSRP